MYTKVIGKTTWPMVMAALSIVWVEHQMVSGLTIYNTALAKKPGSLVKSSLVGSTLKVKSKAEGDTNGLTGHSTRVTSTTVSLVAMELTTLLSQKRLTKDTLRKMYLKAKARLLSRMDVSILEISRQDLRMAKGL
jgi:hypothetical protein